VTAAIENAMQSLFPYLDALNTARVEARRIGRYDRSDALRDDMQATTVQRGGLRYSVRCDGDEWSWTCQR
jgi:cysteinyl-tRNA synthetase